MAIKFTCPHCNKALNVRDEQAGKKGPCPACKKVIAIPALPTGAELRPAVPPSAASSVSPPPAPSTARPAGNPPASERAAPRPTAPTPSKVDPPRPTMPPGKPTGNGAPVPATAPPPPAFTTEDADRAALEALSDEPPPQTKKEEVKFIEFACPQCDAAVKVNRDLEGKQTPCPECRRIVKVPLQKKVEPLDWRKKDAGLPSLAKRDVGPTPEGAWGTQGGTSVSEEALEEAGALPEQNEKTPLKTWIIRGVIAAAALLFLIVGGVWGYSAWAGARQTRLVKQALAQVDEKDPKLGHERDSIVFMSAGEYELRTAKKDSAKSARDHFRRSRSLLREAKPSFDRDCLLIDLALMQIELGGDSASVDKGFRLKWEEVQQELQQTLSLLGRLDVRESISPRGPRAEALRLVCRKLIAKKQTQIAASLAVTASNEPTKADKSASGKDAKQWHPGEIPEAVALAGLEFLSADAADEAKRCADLALKIVRDQKNDSPTEPPVPDKPAPLAVNSPALVTLGLALKIKEIAELPPGEIVNAGRAGLAARQKNTDQIQEIVKQPAQPEMKLYVFAALADAGEPGPALDFAVEESKRSPLSRWLLLQLVRSADNDKERVLGIADNVKEEAVRGRVQLEAIAGVKKEVKVEESLIEEVESTSVSNAVARVLVCRRAAAKGSSLGGKVDKWEEKLRAFGMIGTALGVQDREKK